MRNTQPEPVNGTAGGQPSWHIVTEVPLPLPAPALPQQSDEQLLEGEFYSLDDQPDEPPARGPVRSAPRAAPPTRRLWDDLDALMRLPEPPVTPGDTIFTERYIRRANRRGLWRRLRRMAVAALVGVLLGVATWIWAPLGWPHPLGPPVALPHLGLASPAIGAR